MFCHESSISDVLEQTNPRRIFQNVEQILFEVENRNIFFFNFFKYGSDFIVNVYTKLLIEDEEPLKKCSNCGELKSFSEFSKDKRSKDGLQSQCKICRKEYYENNKEKMKEYRENNKEKIKEYRENNYVRIWCANTIHFHKKRGYIVNITIDELYNIVKDEPSCEICGKELEWYSTGKGKTTNLSPSLDRKNNENEINKDNISILCYKCNAKKNSESIEENVIWCKQFIEYANNILGDN